MTDEQMLFLKFEGSLAKASGVDLSLVKYIRSQGLKKKREEVANFLIDKMNLPRFKKRDSEGKRCGAKQRRPKQFYMERLAVLAKVTDDQWSQLMKPATKENLQVLKDYIKSKKKGKRG